MEKDYCIRWENHDTGVVGYSSTTITKKEAEDLVRHLQSDVYKLSSQGEWAAGLVTDDDGVVVANDYIQHKYPHAFPCRVATVKERDEHEHKQGT